MSVRQAKGFLVSQIKKQAQLENILLADPEIQMLCFTEQDGASLKNQEIAASFDSNFQIAPYEKKISGLMHRAYKRLGKEQSADRETWNAAIRELQRGDHYILVMWGGFSWRSFLILLGGSLIVLSVLAVLRWSTQKFPPPNPHVLQIGSVVFILVCIFFREQFAKDMDFLFESTVTRWFRSKSGSKEP